MIGKLEALKAPELTPEEQAFTAGYMAAEKMWSDMIRKGLDLPDEFLNDVAYDFYIAAMDKYFNKDE